MKPDLYLVFVQILTLMCIIPMVKLRIKEEENKPTPKKNENKFKGESIISNAATHGAKEHRQKQAIQYPLQTGTSDFKKLKEKGVHLADKSLLIRDLLRSSYAQTVLITRPRRFGKSINLSMLRYFFDRNLNTTALFKSNAIMNETVIVDNFFNKYPVIHVSFCLEGEATFSEAFSHFQDIMSQLYDHHSYVTEKLTSEQLQNFMEIFHKKADFSATAEALVDLTEYVEAYYGEPVMLCVDEYDSIVNTGHLHGYYSQSVLLTRIALRTAVKDNSHLYRAFIFGIAELAKEELFSGWQNFEIFSVVDKDFATYFGFQQEEVDQLATAYGYIGGKKTELLRKIKQHYKGYKIGGSTIYNPLSVSKCLEINGKVDNYWLQTGNAKQFNELLSAFGVLPILEAQMLLTQCPITAKFDKWLDYSDIERDRNSFWTFVTTIGYLTFNRCKPIACGFRQYECELVIPNTEVAAAFVDAIKEYYQVNTNVLKYELFVESMKDKNLSVIQNCMQSYVDKSGLFFKEKSLSELVHYFEMLLNGLRKYYKTIATETVKMNTVRFKLSKNDVNHSSNHTSSTPGVVPTELVFEVMYETSGIFKRAWIKFCDFITRAERIEVSVCKGGPSFAITFPQK